MRPPGASSRMTRPSLRSAPKKNGARCAALAHQGPSEAMARMLHPRGCAEERRRQGAQACRRTRLLRHLTGCGCPSGARQRAASSAAAPCLRAPQAASLRKGTQTPGLAFLCLLSFGEAKESRCAAGRASRPREKTNQPPPCTTKKPTPPAPTAAPAAASSSNPPATGSPACAATPPSRQFRPPLHQGLHAAPHRHAARRPADPPAHAAAPHPARPGARPHRLGCRAGHGRGEVRGHRAGARPRCGRVLRIGPVAHRGLLRLQQAGQGADRHQQHRHQFPPVHEQRRRGLQGHAGRGRAAGLL